MSSNSIYTPLPSSAASGVGLGYGIAIAVGILVLVSTIMLASYLCVRVKGGHNPRPDPRPANFTGPQPVPPNVVVGPAHITTEYPKLVFDGSFRRLPRPDDTSCPICLSEYKPEEVLKCVSECNHCFHEGCVDEWLRMSATCPVCRSSPAPSPLPTPLSELIPLAVHGR
ncbi:putative RING-H2 finger protein ATL69 [Acorus gramineus]|uniref:RING-H2 finger protein ATL69 n=1 Tax=Acorus gramineus TaxID=55184 RepID=A0AAV9BPZ9_ACOGR|nr:putative RING-H2 finger protein ATL69 [Acorus gramineus]